MRRAFLVSTLLVACGGEATPPPAPPAPPPAPSAAPEPAPIASAPPAASDAGAAAAPSPAEPALALDFTAPPRTVAVAEFAACAITAKKEVACWGKGSDMEKYPADLVRSKTPKVIAGIKDAQRISAGYRYACAVVGGGDVMCWGMLTAEEDKKGGAKPAKIAGLKDVVDVSVGRYEACARTKSGEISCWGKLDKFSTTPVKMADGAARFDAAGGSLCWVDKGGAATCMGGPASGAHSDLMPSGSKKVMKLPPSSDIAAEVGIACGVTGAKKIACDGDLAEKWSPLVASITDAKAVAIGSGHHFGCAVGESKTTCWGEHELGELGSKPATKDRLSPAIELKLPDAATDIALGNTGGCARTKSNKVYCWGAGSSWIAPERDAIAEVKLP